MRLHLDSVLGLYAWYELASYKCDVESSYKHIVPKHVRVYTSMYILALSLVALKQKGSLKM